MDAAKSKDPQLPLCRLGSATRAVTARSWAFVMFVIVRSTSSINAPVQIATSGHHLRIVIPQESV
jgi:hypothetical protein